MGHFGSSSPNCPLSACGGEGEGEGAGGGEGTIDSSRHTGSVGWAPTPSQYFAREVSSWMSFVGLPTPSAGGLGIGS